MSTIKKVGLISLIISFAFAFVPAFAQETLPQGGSGFDEAVELETGQYSERIVEEDHDEYFLLKDVKPGQRIHMEVFFKDTEDVAGWDYSLKLYDQDRANFLEERREDGSQKLDLYWLPGAPRESNDYYLKMKVGTVYRGDQLKFSLNMEKENFFDAGSGQDAGDTYERAVEVQPGDYSAYFGGSSGDEDDKIDTYELNVDEREELTVKVTPPSHAETAITILNEQRQKVKRTVSDNPGAITTASFASEQGGTYYAEVRMGTGDDQELIEYDVSFNKEEVEPEETEEAPTSEEGKQSLEDIKEEIPEEYQDQLPEDLEGKSPEQIKKEIEKNLPQGVVNNIFEEEGVSGKGIIQGLIGTFFNFLKKVLLWGLGLIIVIVVIIYVFKKMASSGSEEEDGEEVEEDDENSKDKGPNKSDNSSKNHE